MVHLFLERDFEPRITPQDVVAMARTSGWCFELHRVDWRGSLLAADGRRMICQFSAADAESVRMALRKAGADTTRLWLGSVHAVPDRSDANVAVERSFAAPVALEELQAQEDAKRWCLETRRVDFVKTYLALDRKRMICLYSAPDAEAVRAAQREAEMPMDAAWAFERIDPAAAAG